MTAQPSAASAHPHSSVSPADLQRCTSPPLSQLVIKMLNNSGPGNEPWDTSLITGLQLDLVPPLTPVIQTGFNTLCQLSVMIVWETVSKALLK